MAKFNDDLKKFNDNEICYLSFGNNSIIKKVIKNDYFDEKYHLEFIRKIIESLFLGTLSNELFGMRKAGKRQFKENRRGELINWLKQLPYCVYMASASSYKVITYWELTYTDDYHIEFVVSDDLTIKFIPSKSFVLSLNKLIDVYTTSPNYRKGECNFELCEELIKDLNNDSKGLYEKFNMIEFDSEQNKEKKTVNNEGDEINE